MNFYNNDMLLYLRNNKTIHNYRLLSETVGVLVIFDENFNALCILIESYNKDLSKLSDEERDALNISKYFYQTIGLPFYFLKYSDDDLTVNSNIEYIISGMQTTNSCLLGDFFTNIIKNTSVNFTLTSKNTPTKAINDKTSTPFHIWQRSNLGYSGFPVDIDMVFIQNNILHSLIEIKRSYIRDWKPYKADKNNYLAMCKLCNLAEINFFLFFIPQHKNGSIKTDDYNNIAIYDIFHRIGNYKNADDIFFSKRATLDLSNLIKLNFSFFKQARQNNTWTEK